MNQNQNNELFKFKVLEIEEHTKYFDQLVNLFNDTFSSEPWCDSWNIEDLKQYIKECLEYKNGLNFIVLDGDKVIAMCFGRLVHWFTGMQYRADELCVSNSYQGKGIGNNFLNSILEYLKKSSIKSMIFDTERPFPCYKFYLKHGFKENMTNANMIKIFDE